MSSGEDGGGSLMTVPEPSPAYPQDNMERLQKAISSMEERGMQQDPRYNHLISMANRAKMGSGSSATPSPQPDPSQQQQQGPGRHLFDQLSGVKI